MAHGSMTDDDVLSTELAAGDRGSTLAFGTAAPGPLAPRLRLVAAYDLQQAVVELLRALASRGRLLQPTLQLAWAIGQAIALQCSPKAINAARATLDRAMSALRELERDADGRLPPPDQPVWFQDPRILNR